eukprot:1145627-Pelagomonas_calceolata.AAC.4
MLAWKQEPPSSTDSQPCFQVFLYMYLHILPTDQMGEFLASKEIPGFTRTDLLKVKYATPVQSQG